MCVNNSNGNSNTESGNAIQTDQHCRDVSTGPDPLLSKHNLLALNDNQGGSLDVVSGALMHTLQTLQATSNNNEGFFNSSEQSKVIMDVALHRYKMQFDAKQHAQKREHKEQLFSKEHDWYRKLKANHDLIWHRFRRFTTMCTMILMAVIIAYHSHKVWETTNWVQEFWGLVSQCCSSWLKECSIKWMHSCSYYRTCAGLSHSHFDYFLLSTGLS